MRWRRKPTMRTAPYPQASGGLTPVPSFRARDPDRSWRGSSFSLSFNPGAAPIQYGIGVKISRTGARSEIALQLRSQALSGYRDFHLYDKGVSRQLDGLRNRRSLADLNEAESGRRLRVHI